MIYHEYDLEVEIYLRRKYAPPITHFYSDKGGLISYLQRFIRLVVRWNFVVPQEFGVLCVCTSDSHSLCSAGIELLYAKAGMGILYQNVEKGRKMEGLNFLGGWANIQGYGITGNYCYQPQGAFDPLHRFWLCKEVSCGLLWVNTEVCVRGTQKLQGELSGAANKLVFLACPSHGPLQTHRALIWGCRDAYSSKSVTVCRGY